MRSSGTRWKTAFVLIMSGVAVWMLWASVQLVERRASEDIAQRELTSLAEQNRAACERDPVAAARVLGPGVCQTAKEITERPPAEKGDPGEPGARGPMGPPGEQGPRGPAGDAGPQGARGPTGADGSSPACLMTANACTGPSGARGPVGATGAAGDKGEQGDQGLTGERGAQGLQGATGAKGDTGERGAQGEAGADGRGLVSIECDSQTAITFRWTWTDGTVSTATCGGVDPPPPTVRR